MEKLPPEKNSSLQEASGKKSLFRSSSIVGSMTMSSRILGLIRDVCFARFVGAEAGADAFYVAFKIPNFFRRLFAEGAFSQAFVPVLSEYRTKGSSQAVKLLIDHVCGALGSVLLLFTVLAVLGAPVVATLFAPGFVNDEVKFDLATDLLRITFPYLFLISMTGFAGAVLNSYDRFAIPALTPIWLNICLIGAALFAAPYFSQPAYALAWGVLIAGVVQLLFQLPFLAQLQLMPKPKVNFRHEGVIQVLSLMAPAIFGVSVSQLNLLLDTVLASFLPTGSVSWLYYSDRLSELPLGVFAVAIGTVILPNLSRLHASEDPGRFNATLDWALRMIVMIAVPAALALILLAEPILSTLFLYGKTTAFDIEMSTWSLRAYALGLVAFMLIKVLAPGFYARQDMKTPVKIGIKAMIANMVFNVVFVVPLYFYLNLGHVGLALATSVSAFLNAGWLLHELKKREVYQPEPVWKRMFFTQAVANGVMALLLVLILTQVPSWIEINAAQRCLWLLLLCVVGGGSYLLSLYACGIRAKDLRPSR